MLLSEIGCPAEDKIKVTAPFAFTCTERVLIQSNPPATGWFGGSRQLRGVASPHTRYETPTSMIMMTL